MKTLIFDPFSGASGDMILGTLIGLGADREKVCRIIESVADVCVSVGRANKQGIEAVDVNIEVEHETHSRHYRELVDIIKKASLPGPVEKDALNVFKIMADAESRVHGQGLDELHFHEVGQNDAIADVVGACVAISDIGADRILCRPINVGGGFVKAAHGTLPVPAPATLEILKDSDLTFYGKGSRELLTPTGAALLSYYSKPAEDIPAGRVLETGYGAGNAETESPNVLRSILLDTAGSLAIDPIEVLETNVDDVSGEVLGNLFSRLLQLGAKDVSIIPATMKKGRPGSIIKVITKAEDSQSLAREIFRETGSLGIRVMPVKHRFIARRRIETIDIEIAHTRARSRVKIAGDEEGQILHISAEFEDCREIAGRTGMAVKEVIRNVEEMAWELFGPE